LRPRCLFPVSRWTDSTGGRNWQGTPDDEFQAKLAQALQASPDWVLDGNYNRTRPLKWRNVDVVVWVDYGFTRTLWQAVTEQ
jgi:hypothetical protein